jgi:four helix bundle protein
MMNQSAQPATDTTAMACSNGRASGESFARRATGCLPARSGSGSLEDFDCYRLAIEFAALSATLVPRGHGALRDQLERASTSVVLNLAEGWGHWQARSKAQFYTIARGSLLESGAAIELLRARGLAGEAECGRARELCARVGQMLAGLIRSVGRRCSMVG